VILDDLELELRKLPGVRATGFDDRDDVLMIQLHVATDPGGTLEVPLPIAATRIATRHSERPVAVEVVRWRDPAPATTGSVTPIGPAPASGAGPVGEVAKAAAVSDLEAPERPRLLAVLSFPDTDELEVHLVFAGNRTIGRAPAKDGLVGAVEATLEAIRGLGIGLAPNAGWALTLESGDEGSLVAAAIDLPDTNAETGSVRLYGLASGSSPIDAAARATLDAVNRRLTHQA
jgi:hypothetical protein